MNPDEGAYDPQIRGTFVFMIHNQCSMILYHSKQLNNCMFEQTFTIFFSLSTYTVCALNIVFFP